jgi:CubicO group peptidase (beta-lactamase class C family)
MMDARLPLWLGATAFAAASAAPIEAQRLPAVDDALRPLIASGQLAGAVTLALRDGKPIHASAIGKKDLASGGGGLVTTAADYARFGEMLLEGGTLDGTRILSPAAARTIMIDHLPTALIGDGFGIGFQRIHPGYQFGYNGVIVTDPVAANVALGKGSYLWDGRAGTWLWVDPENRVVFVGMIQRVMSDGGRMPQVQDLTQRAVADSLRADGG